MTYRPRRSLGVGQTDWSRSTLADENAEGSATVERDQSVWPTPSDRRGLYVIHYEVPSAGIGAAASTTAVDMVTWSIPQGTILWEDAAIEVQTALLPASGTTALKVGNATLLAAGNDLESTGIKDLDVGPTILTSSDVPYLEVQNVVATQGAFTVYLPVVMGNAGNW